MNELVTINGITFDPTGIENGWIMEKLEDWHDLPEVVLDQKKRPLAHGSYSPTKTFVGAATPSLEGKFFGFDHAEAMRARELLTGLYNNGRPVVMTVTDALRTTHRQVLVKAVDIPWTPHNIFEFTIDLEAPDPRRYTDSVRATTGLPIPGSGLVWPLGSTTGAFYDWGTEGSLGQVSFTNEGNTPTNPVAVLDPNGADLVGGFRVIEVETGREIVYPGLVVAGMPLSLNSRTRRAKVGTSDVTGALTRREWFEVPAGATYRYQLATLQGTANDPQLTIVAASAIL